jgi:copper homeostasis protein
MKVTVEVCTDNCEDTIQAIRLGADRIELCSDLANDGLTPSEELFELVMQTANKWNVTIFPMIRCRAGNFVYSETEKSTMIQQANRFSQLGAHGIVIGALTPENHIDLPFVREIYNAVHTVNPRIQITFHRAIDYAVVPSGKSLGDIVAQLIPFCDRVLTSGQCNTALEGAEAIKSIVSRIRRPFVLAAGKIRQENVRQVVETLNVTEVHSRSPQVAVALGKPRRSV